MAQKQPGWPSHGQTAQLNEPAPEEPSPAQEQPTEPAPASDDDDED